MEKNVRQVIQKLGIDVPVMDARVVGSRIELYLYGGGVVVARKDGEVIAADAPGIMAVAEAEAPGLEKLKVSELKELAKAKGIEGYSSMRKAELIEALQDLV